MSEQIQSALGEVSEVTSRHVDIAEPRQSDAAAQCAEVDESEPESLGPTIRRYGNVIKRNSAINEVQFERNPLPFYGDVRLTPIKVTEGVYNILSSKPGLQAPNFKWKYSMVYHGLLTYSWSLLKISPEFQKTAPVLRPIAILETSSKHFRASEMRVTNLEHPLEARSIRVCHYRDSWSSGGNHVGFQLDSDYAYEWQSVECPPGSRCYELYLWRINLNTPERPIPAARIVAQNLIQNPMKPSKPGNKEPLWCVDLDLDRVPAHIALISAFAIRATNSRFHAWFAPKVTELPPALPLINFAFQDEGRILQRSEKFWGDWEDSRRRGDGQKDVDLKKVHLIRVFNKAFLKSYAVPDRILEMLDAEANQNIALFRAKFSIFG